MRPGMAPTPQRSVGLDDESVTELGQVSPLLGGHSKAGTNIFVMLIIQAYRASIGACALLTQPVLRNRSDGFQWSTQSSLTAVLLSDSHTQTRPWPERVSLIRPRGSQWRFAQGPRVFGMQDNAAEKKKGEDWINKALAVSFH
jgi:hypothetical protein